MTSNDKPLPAAVAGPQPCEQSHNPTTCWWCLNESPEYCAEMKKAMIGDGRSSTLRIKLAGGVMRFEPRESLQGSPDGETPQAQSDSTSDGAK